MDNLVLKSSDIARFCQVDLKTVHNWVARGHLLASRTPGRHMRFEKAALGRDEYAVSVEQTLARMRGGRGLVP